MSTQLDKLLAIASSMSRGEVPKYQYDECFTSGAFDLLLVNVRDGEAFGLLRDACRRYLEEKEAGTGMAGYYLLLGLLARQSNTTEMPDEMPSIFKDNPALSGNLKRWYRFEC